MGGDVFHRGEPDVAARHQPLQKLVPDMPTRQPPGGERMHHRHPEPAIGVARLEFLREGGKTFSGARIGIM